MTCREMLAKEHPESVGSDYIGGCHRCPSDYNYLSDPVYCVIATSIIKGADCTRCWNRELPKEKEKNNE